MRVRVVGAGIVGSACALHCADAGHQVELVAAETLDETTSAVAAALWYPYRALPQNAVTRWARLGFAELAAMATDPATGVDMRAGRQIFRELTADPWWLDAAPPLERIPVTSLPAGYADGFRLTVPVVDMPLHLRWLDAQLRARGVTIVRRRVGSLNEARAGVDVAVNCTGLAARQLAFDDSVYPVRGQVVLVRQRGIEQWLLDESDPAYLTYVVPRRDSVVIGGTALDGDGDMRVRPNTAREIMRKAVELMPELAGAEVVAHRVGLRPARPSVRLERDGDVVHCYGHGGAGVTLAYGCAQDVLELLAGSG